MPTYEYACKACGDHIEVVQSFKDDPLATCPSCGGALRKVFGSIGIVFKGSGFYKTDSRSSDQSRTGAGRSTAQHGAGTPAGASAGEGTSSAAGGEASKPAGSASGSSVPAAPGGGAGTASSATSKKAAAVGE